MVKFHLVTFTNLAGTETVVCIGKESQVNDWAITEAYNYGGAYTQVIKQEQICLDCINAIAEGAKLKNLCNY